MALRLQNNTEICIIHPQIRSIYSIINFDNEMELKKAIIKINNYYSITYDNIYITVTVDFMEIYDNYIHVIVNSKMKDNNDNNYSYKYNCAFDDKLKKYLLSI